MRLPKHGTQASFMSIIKSIRHTRVITSAFGFQLLKSPINDADWKGKKNNQYIRKEEKMATLSLKCQS